MTRRSPSAPKAVVVGVALLIVVAVFGWLAVSDKTRTTTKAPPQTPIDVSAEAIDAANEGKLVRATGALRASGAARDRELGVAADAAVLLRKVDMYQWQERCTGGKCNYDLDWRDRAVDSSGFRERDGHDNPAMPFATARFAANALKLGAFEPDVATIEASGAPSIAVKLSDLPPNLRATFRDVDGALYAGNDPAHLSVGDLRVDYRVVPLGAASAVGVQHGTRLVAPAASPASNKD